MIQIGSCTATGACLLRNHLYGALMPTKKSDVHTTPNLDGKGWVNQTGRQVISQHRTKETAVARGRQEAISRKAEHSIHNKDGKIRQKNSYGGDPNPPKDRR